ncbi:DEAD-box helicase Dbp80 [Aedes albopictus]|uniref:RNA helicase n=1 Tax=Aedes albopictus TaxID=7160 RepID=A0ABM1YDX2_AEDAL|nr:DEAD-box helicase Dbp80 [Aedes albopictus]XP_029729775.1 DEAD-box helicase Dbp80 [Aedes albopictus]
MADTTASSASGDAAALALGSDWIKKAEDQEISTLVNELSIDKEKKEVESPVKKEPTTEGKVSNSSTAVPATAALSEPVAVKEEPAASENGETVSSAEDAEAFNPADASLLMKIIRKGLVESKLDLEVQRKDPSSPLFSVKTFEALHLKPELLQGVYAMGFNAPSKIQETALPTLLADPPQNMIAQSQSGTGKTAAFVLAMLSRVDPRKNYPQVICLSPTYELAIQTGEVAAKMAKFCPEIKLRYAVRGEEIAKGAKLTDHIIIGTPGKLLDWGIKFRAFDLKKITVFVLDEADVMIATQGHQDQCIRIHKQLSSQCQMMFFSATYEREVMEFAEYIVPNPIVIRLAREQESLDNIKQYYVKCRNQDEKYQAISNIYGVITVGQAIIFCHTRKTAGWLSGKMSQDGHSVAVLSGELTVEQRLAVLDRFRAGLEKVLITTNVLSRGIDVEQVTIVVNFDLPMDQNGRADCETYLHRIGRTGRFGKNGIAINLVDSDRSMAICRSIEAHFQKKIHLLDAENSDEIEKIGS